MALNRQTSKNGLGSNVIVTSGNLTKAASMCALSLWQLVNNNKNRMLWDTNYTMKRWARWKCGRRFRKDLCYSACM